MSPVPSFAQEVPKLNLKNKSVLKKTIGEFNKRLEKRQKKAYDVLICWFQKEAKNTINLKRQPKWLTLARVTLAPGVWCVDKKVINWLNKKWLNSINGNLSKLKLTLASAFLSTFVSIAWRLFGDNRLIKK